MTKSLRARRRATLLGSCLLLGLTAVQVHAAGAPSLIPLPASYQADGGKDFVLKDAARVGGNDEASRRVAAQFVELLRQNGGPTLAVAENASKAQIRFRLDPSATKPAEAYTLKVSNTGIDVSASDDRGLFYGAVTAAQLLTDQTPGEVAAATITDAPRFVWRGLMLDSARHFQSMDEIRKLLDAMAQHKLNTFHWHLTDDQGWRMEIKRYPKLTEVGSCRVPLGDAGRDPATGEPRRYCGYYTQAQIREIVAYAAERHIQVIPEIDVPGHATAAIAAYPELGVTGRKLAIDNQWGVFPNLFNTEESTLQFLENVLLEVIDMFPARYVHVGGDEAVKDQWIASPRVQEHMRRLGLKDEMEMQSHMIKRLEKFLEQHDRRLIGWDEILEGGLRRLPRAPAGTAAPLPRAGHRLRADRTVGGDAAPGRPRRQPGAGRAVQPAGLWRHPLHHRWQRADFAVACLHRAAGRSGAHRAAGRGVLRRQAAGRPREPMDAGRRRAADPHRQDPGAVPAGRPPAAAAGG